MVENSIDEHTEDEVMEILDGIAKSAYTRGYLAGQEAVRKTYKAQSKMVPVKSPNQQRAELIQRAREFVEEHTKYNAKASGGRGVSIKPYYVAIPEFYTNEKKRTVTVLFKGVGTPNKLYAKGIAKCQPGEVFNEDIGKAIALARALEIDVPWEFLQAVQPTEKVTGMKVKSLKTFPEAIFGPFKIGDIFELVECGISKSYVCEVGSTIAINSNILDDTNAIYKEEMK